MAATRKVQGVPIPGLAPEKDEHTVQLTTAELNEIISNAVSAAVIAAGQNQAPVVMAPQSNVNNDMSAPRTRLEMDFNDRMVANNALGQIISHEETIPYAIPQLYGQYVGSVLVAVNGQSVKIPADGIKRNIPKRYVPIIQQYIDNVDKKVATMNQTVGVQYGGCAELKGGAF